MRWVLVMAAITGCVPPAQQPGYYPSGPNNGGYASGGYNNGGYAEPDPNANGYEPQAQPAPQPPPRNRNITINGARLGAREAATLANLEAMGGVTLPDGAYWYDPVSGAFGNWGQPPIALIGPGHALGPKLPANASGGTSGVYINGRRLQVIEVQGLSAMTNYPWQPGRYFIDAQMNVGVEGGPVIANLVAVIQAQQQQQQGSGNNGGGARGWTMGLGGYDRGAFSSDGKCRVYTDTKGVVIQSGC
jgi:hypothetical protein